MESGYNYQYLYDLLKSKGYNVKVAHPLMVKAIAYAKVKTDKVDARILADLLRTDMIPECYIPDEKIRNLRDLARRRHYFVNTRTMFKNKVHVELSKRWIDYSTGNSSKSDLFTQKGREYLRSLKISSVKDRLDTVDFLDTKIQEMDNQIKTLASIDKHAKHMITIPGISYYAALLISSEIAYIKRFPDYEHLSSYAKLVPGTHQSGETQYSKADMKGSQMLNWIMVQCTHTHVRHCNSSVARHYNKIKSRKGTKIAIIAAARKMIRVIYVMLKEDRSFRPDG
jgi:transposase